MRPKQPGLIVSTITGIILATQLPAEAHQDASNHTKPVQSRTNVAKSSVGYVVSLSGHAKIRQTESGAFQDLQTLLHSHNPFRLYPGDWIRVMDNGKLVANVYHKIETITSKSGLYYVTYPTSRKEPTPAKSAGRIAITPGGKVLYLFAGIIHSEAKSRLLYSLSIRRSDAPKITFDHPIVLRQGTATKFYNATTRCPKIVMINPEIELRTLRHASPVVGKISTHLDVPIALRLRSNPLRGSIKETRSAGITGGIIVGMDNRTGESIVVGKFDPTSYDVAKHHLNAPVQVHSLSDLSENAAINTRPARYFLPTNPVIPDTLNNTLIDNLVTIRVSLNADGTIHAVIAKSSGYPELDESARACCSLIKFTPAMENGLPVADLIDLSFHFSNKKPSTLP